MVVPFASTLATASSFDTSFSAGVIRLSSFVPSDSIRSCSERESSSCSDTSDSLACTASCSEELLGVADDELFCSDEELDFVSGALFSPVEALEV